MKNKYNDKKITITKSLEHYVKSKDFFDLINYKDLHKIKNKYKEFLIGNQLPLDDINSNNENENLDYYIKKENNYYSCSEDNEP